MASTHAQKRIKEQKDALRLKFKGVQYIAQIDRDQIELENQANKVRLVKASKADPHKAAEVIAKADCINRLIKTKMDVNFRRLAKIIPDLKQVEMVDDDGKNVLGNLAVALAAAVSNK